jgi:hypothetical protein
LHAWRLVTGTVACAVSFGGVTSTCDAIEQGAVTSLYPRLKYAVSLGLNETAVAAMFSKDSEPPRTTVVGKAAPLASSSSIPG